MQSDAIAKQKKAFRDLFWKYRQTAYIRENERERRLPWRKEFWLQTFYNLLQRIFPWINPIERWRAKRGKKFAKFMEGILRGITGKETFLDLGCGQGHIARALLDLLSKNNPALRAICIDDKTEVMRSMWQDDLAFWWGSVLDSEIPSSSVDIIFAGYILQVLNEKERGRLFDEIYRMLAPGGIVIFLEVVEISEEQDAVNAKKHRGLNPNTRYLVMSREGWRSYIDIDGCGLQVRSMTNVDDRSVAYEAKIRSRE